MELGMQKIFINHEKTTLNAVAVVGGILAGLSYEQGHAILMPFALALLWSISRNCLASSVWGTCAVLVSHRWILWLHPLNWIGVPKFWSLPIACFILILCACIGGFLVGIWSFINKKSSYLINIFSLSFEQVCHALFMSTLWGLAEVYLAKTPLFWIGIGSSFVKDDLILAGLARWIGIGGLASLQLLIGWWIWHMTNAIRRGSQLKKLFSTGLIFILLMHLIGWNLLHPIKVSSTRTVALWQPAIPTREKFSEEQQSRLPEVFTKVLNKASDSNADWIIAPEGFLPIGRKLFLKTPLPLLSGGFRWVDGRQRSSLLVFLKGSDQFSSFIDKHRLVPLGEWVPSWLGRGFSGISAVGSLESGEPSRFLKWAGPNAAVAICYEISNGSSLARAVNQGADWLLAIANLDPYPLLLQNQYTYLAQIRSIEMGRDLLNASNTGPSMLISSNGEVTKLLPSFKEGLAFTKLNLHQRTTGYILWKEFPLFVLVSIGAIGISPLRKRRPKGS